MFLVRSAWWQTIVACLLVLAALFTALGPAAAQTPNRPCLPQVPPPDGFASGGVGLTGQELAALYGAGQPGQGSIIYNFKGIDLNAIDCDLILVFPETWIDNGEQFELTLARQLLPDDAEYVGSFRTGSLFSSYQTAELWRSDSLAARFALVGADRGAEILVVYTYAPQGMERGRIQLVELRPIQLPED